MLPRTTLLLLIVNIALWGQSMSIAPIDLPVLDREQRFLRALYAVDSFASTEDTLLFLHKVENLTCVQVDSISPFELSVVVQIDSGFSAPGIHEFVVLDRFRKARLQGALQINSNVRPTVDTVWCEQDGRVCADTLLFDSQRSNRRSVWLEGSGIFRDSEILFDDPALKFLAPMHVSSDQAPARMNFAMEINGSAPRLGWHLFHIRHAFAPEGSGRLFLGSRQAPQIYTRIPGFVADGNEQTARLRGSGFFPGLEVELLPDEGSARVRLISSEEIEVGINLPMLLQSQSYRLVVRNGDGKADTTAAFSVGALPLPGCRVKSVENGVLYFDTGARVAFVAQVRNRLRLDPRNSYELRIGDARFPVTAVVDDSTFEAPILLPRDSGSTLIRERIFTVHQLEGPALWKGFVRAEMPPRLDYFSPERILQPLDTLQVVVKGQYLDKAQLVFSDPAISVKILENRGDLISAQIFARKQVEPGEYGLELRIDAVRFLFPHYTIRVKPWVLFDRYVHITTRKMGRTELDTLWQGASSVYRIDRDESIVLQFDGTKLREDDGIQKVLISGVLLDSMHTVRAEGVNTKWLVIHPGQRPVSWQWRVREKLNSGDRIEITLANPGNLNRSTERFSVNRHWSQSFHGSTSFVVVKLPFDGSKASTEILKSITLGLTYTPNPEQPFLAYDAAFIIGNVNSAANVPVQVGLGASVILLQYIQIGLGTNLTDSPFRRSFMFLGTRFKLPSF
ncbi:MAG TPA: hypothetical protein PKW76_09645 [bacterium]|nr:hypothetical protein [bacterium]HPG45932.1 hypothetical protein [bacterium]HPM97754.1 hypothetical protein [bacterium]